MSNEMKDWLYDVIAEQVLESGMADKIDKIETASYFMPNRVNGYKHGEKVYLCAWFDNNTGMWKIEHRERMI